MFFYQTCLPLPFDELLLLTIAFCSLLKTIHAEILYNSPYKIHPPKSGDYVINTDVDVKSMDAREINDIPVNLLEIKWENSTTDSVTISWKLSADYNLTGYIRDSVVEYITSVGRFRSHPLPSEVRIYRFENLDAGTVYTFCVYMSEIHGAHNFSTDLHSKCVKINTLDYIRRDSVIVMMITLGYYLFMGLLGFTQWKRRQCRIANRKRIDKRYANEIPTDNNVCVMRWQDLAERERLMSKPGCSIECNDT